MAKQNNPWLAFLKQYKGQGIPRKQLSEMYQQEKNKKAKNASIKLKFADENQEQLLLQQNKIQKLSSDLSSCKQELKNTKETLEMMKQLRPTTNSGSSKFVSKRRTYA